MSRETIIKIKERSDVREQYGKEVRRLKCAAYRAEQRAHRLAGETTHLATRLAEVREMKCVEG